MTGQRSLCGRCRIDRVKLAIRLSVDAGPEDLTDAELAMLSEDTSVRIAITAALCEQPGA